MWIIDYESSGIHDDSYPLSVGIFNGTKSYYAIIKPINSWTHWDDSSQVIHQLKRPDLIANGQSPSSVAQLLNSQLLNEIVYCDCEQWDGFWNQRLFDAGDETPSFIIRDIQKLFSNEFHLMNQYFQYKKEMPDKLGLTLHHALDDAKIIWHALDKVLAEE